MLPLKPMPVCFDVAALVRVKTLGLNTVVVRCSLFVRLVGSRRFRAQARLTSRAAAVRGEYRILGAH